MEKFAYTLENLFQEKILLYTDLKTIFEQEKNYIVDMDVDSLWKMTDKKKQIAIEIERIRERILSLFEENNFPLNMTLKSFNLSQVINCLPFSAKRKSDFKKAKLKIDISKKDLAGIASENQRYNTEYLSVINGIFATITASENRESYTKAGMILKDKAEKYLIRAEV